MREKPNWEKKSRAEMDLQEMIAAWPRWSFRDRLNNTPRLIVLAAKNYFKGMSPAFICFIVVVEFFEAFVYESWKGLEAIMSHILVSLGSKYAIYTVIYPDIQPVREPRITLTLSTFGSILAADLPYIIAYVDLELRPSLFSIRGLLSFIICFSTVADIYVFKLSLQMGLSSVLYWQSFLRFMVFVGLIIVGGANMIEKTWSGALVLHKHVLIPLCLCVFGFIRLSEKCRRLRRLMKKAMIVMPVDD